MKVRRKRIAKRERYEIIQQKTEELCFIPIPGGGGFDHCPVDCVWVGECHPLFRTIHVF